jgi:broad specificity phosphatase PhoE
VRRPRRPWRTPITPTRALAAIVVLILGLTGCTSAGREPLPTVSPAAPSTTVVLPSATSTTTVVVPTATSTTTVVLPTATSTTTVVLPTATSTTIGPTSSPVPNWPAQWTFVVVRHANWRDDGSKDPPLTEAGEIRARRLADLIHAYPGVATYATRFRRARDTARPTAVLWEVPVTTYDIALAPAELVNQIKQRHPQGAILIVAHSDTMPAIVAEICRCPTEPNPEIPYANRNEVDLGSDGSILRVDHQSSY